MSRPVLWRGATEVAGGIRIVDVWESAEDATNFGETQLRRAIEQVAAANGLDLSQMPNTEPKIEEAFEIVLP